MLGGGFKYFLFSTLPGEDFQFDEHIFQMGWFNHQLAILGWAKHFFFSNQGHQWNKKESKTRG